MRTPMLLPVSLVLFACASEVMDANATLNENANAPVSGPTDMDLGLPAPEQGFVRYRTPLVRLEAGESKDWAQWLGGPLDQDYDVVAIRGAQGVGGHHALVYATPEAQAPGFTRLWTDADQLKTRLMGGVGGEGGANAVLPEGVVFRVREGSYFLAQTHYLNPLESAIEGRTVLDIQLAPVDTTKQVASIFSMVDAAVMLPPGVQTELDMHCTLESDLVFLQISNHMHEYGVSTYTEYVDPSGETHMLKQDPAWNYEWSLNPNFTFYSLAEPMVIPAGSELHTHCAWQNDTAEAVAFPAEMCVFFGFILAERDIICLKGNWSESGM